MITFNLNRIVILVLTVLIVSCKTETKSTSIDEAYKKELDSFQMEKDQSRKSSYLKLTGLFKLNDSITTFGRDSTNTFQLSLEDLPPTIATIFQTDSTLLFQAANGVVVKTANDSAVKTMPLYLDEYGSSVRLYHERLNWQVITRSNLRFLRVWDDKNPAINAFPGFDWFDLNPDLIFNAQFTYFKQPKEEMVKAEVDGQRSTSFIGQVVFMYDGEMHNLDVGANGFTMVSDITTGETTYGGGRYMYLNLPKQDSILRLDFNKLYNPPCAFSEFTTCIYPPRQNHLPFEVLAGETIRVIN